MSYRLVTCDREGKVSSERRGIVHYDSVLAYAENDLKQGAAQVTVWNGDTVAEVFKSEWLKAKAADETAIK